MSGKPKPKGKGEKPSSFTKTQAHRQAFFFPSWSGSCSPFSFFFFFYFLFFSSGNSAKGQKIAAKVEEVLEKKRKQPEVSSDDFPRGGASGLTPLEYKEIKLQVDAELFKVRKREERKKKERES